MNFFLQVSQVSLGSICKNIRWSGFCSGLEWSLTGVWKLLEIRLKEIKFLHWHNSLQQSEILPLCFIHIFFFIVFFFYLIMDMLFFQHALHPPVWHAGIPQNPFFFFPKGFQLTFPLPPLLLNFPHVNGSYMVFTSLLPFSKTCPHYISLLACGFTLLPDRSHCLQLKLSRIPQTLLRVQSRRKLVPGFCVGTVFPQNLTQALCQGFASAGTVFFGFADLQYHLLLL